MVIESALAGLLVAMVFLVVLLQVLLRYLLAYPSPWGEELSRFGLIWLSMLGAAQAVAHRSHFAFHQLTDSLPLSFRRRAAVAARALSAAVAAILVIGGVALVRLALGQRTPALDLPMALVYAAVPAAGLLMLIHLSANPLDVPPPNENAPPA